MATTTYIPPKLDGVARDKHRLIERSFLKMRVRIPEVYVEDFPLH
jgi:hypothetical protein